MALRPPFSALPQLHQHGLQHPCTGLQGVSCPSQDSLQHPVHNGAHLQVLQHYQQNTGALTDKATSNVDNVFENCADYTATQGYECVPYYQCHNGTIITDGGGLIDIRNGFGILSPEDSKCPGFLDV